MRLSPSLLLSALLFCPTSAQAEKRDDIPGYLVGHLTDDTSWEISAADAGKMVFGGSEIAFSGIENLEGAADNEDTFTVTEGGSLSGVMDGGAAGFDTLVLNGGSYDTVVYTVTGPTSGTIDRDGDTALEIR